MLKEQVVPEPVLRTLLIEVKGILNDKPLRYVSCDVADPDPVTPNMLPMGSRDSLLPQALYNSEDRMGRLRWKHCQVLANNFWSSFVRQYLLSLQDCPKWQTDSRELSFGLVVLVVDPRFTTASWPAGAVTETYPALDGRVKVKIYTHPVVWLIPLCRLGEEDICTAGGLSGDGQSS